MGAKIGHFFRCGGGWHAGSVDVGLFLPSQSAWTNTGGYGGWIDRAQTDRGLEVDTGGTEPISWG
jgi:hypothetical protein